MTAVDWPLQGRLKSGVERPTTYHVHSHNYTHHPTQSPTHSAPLSRAFVLPRTAASKPVEVSQSQSKMVEVSRSQSKTVEDGRSQSNQGGSRSQQSIVYSPHPMSFVCRLLVRIPFLSSFPLSMTPVCHSMTPMTLGPTSRVSSSSYFALASFCFASSLSSHLGRSYLSKRCF